MKKKTVFIFAIPFIMISCGKPYCNFSDSEKADIVTDAESFGIQYALKKHNIDEGCLEKLKVNTHIDQAKQQNSESKPIDPQDPDVYSTSNIEEQVTRDAVIEYGIAKRQGDKMQIYVSASMVCAACLQSKNEVAYKYWKTVEDTARQLVGIPKY
jgi:hypothetical protein